MPSILDEFFIKHTAQFGAVGTGWRAVAGSCSSCKGLGYGHVMLIVKRTGQLFYSNQYGEHDLGGSAAHVCSTCGQVTGNNLGTIAYAKTAAPAATTLVTKQGLAAVIAKATVSYNHYANPMKWPVSTTFKNTKCECGAHKTGALNNSPAHSSWCPEYNAAPKTHVETHEELVARVKAGKKGAQSTP